MLLALATDGTTLHRRKCGWSGCSDLNRGTLRPKRSGLGQASPHPELNWWTCEDSNPALSGASRPLYQMSYRPKGRAIAGVPLALG